MQRTNIEWTDWSCTPLKMQLPDGALVNACVKISQGCSACYAESLVRRFWKKEWGAFPGYTKALLRIGKPFLVEKELQAVLRLDARIAAGKADPAANKVFWNDMTDEFLDYWPDEFRDRLFAVRALTPNLVHQVLTKRAERMREYFAETWQVPPQEHEGTIYAGGIEDREQRVKEAARQMLLGNLGDDERYWREDGWSHVTHAPWPLPNCWLGVSCENQQTADARIPHLLQTPAAVRFLSVEPLLGPLSLSRWLGDIMANGQGEPITSPDALRHRPPEISLYNRFIHWAIVGGESGKDARLCHTDWIRALVEQCRKAGTPCFVKQLGSDARYASGQFSQPNPRYGAPVEYLFKLGLKHPKGGDINEFPEDLRVRQFPERSDRVQPQ